jgi:hypothetical protein
LPGTNYSVRRFWISNKLVRRKATHWLFSSMSQFLRRVSLIRLPAIILVIFYHMLKSGTRYTDLGGVFFDRLEPQRMTRYYVKRLESLGHKVTLESCAAA